MSNALRDLADSTGHSLRLDTAVWQSLLAVVDADDNGNVDWTELVQFMGEVFMHIEREKALQGLLKEQATSTNTAVPITTHEGVQPAGPAVALKMRQSKDVMRVQLETDGQY